MPTQDDTKAYSHIHKQISHTNTNTHAQIGLYLSASNMHAICANSMLLSTSMYVLRHQYWYNYMI